MSNTSTIEELNFIVSLLIHLFFRSSAYLSIHFLVVVMEKGHVC